MNHPHEPQAAAMARTGELADGEQLRECINSGQVSAAQVVAHADAQELSMSMFVSRKDYEQYLTTQLEAALQDRDEWKDATLSANERFKKAETALAAERAEVARLREALEGAYALAIGHATTYQLNHQLAEVHPTHQAILDKARAALTAPGEKHE